MGLPTKNDDEYLGKTPLHYGREFRDLNAGDGTLTLSRQIQK